MRRETNLQTASETHQEKGEKLQHITLQWEVTTDNVEIQIIRNNYKQLHANNVENMEEMDKFLEKYRFSRLNQEETEKRNKPIISTEIKTVVKTFQKTKAQGQMTSQRNSIKSLEKS